MLNMLNFTNFFGYFEKNAYLCIARVKTSLDTSRDNKDIINMYNIISIKL